ncbi:MAG: hypothetical protein AVDCRST_MAG76-2463, partial [uncultured Acidimicrobiales bacterium]
DRQGRRAGAEDRRLPLRQLRRQGPRLPGRQDPAVPVRQERVHLPHRRAGQQEL